MVADKKRLTPSFLGRSHRFVCVVFRVVASRVSCALRALQLVVSVPLRRVWSSLLGLRPLASRVVLGVSLGCSFWLWLFASAVPAARVVSGRGRLLLSLLAVPRPHFPMSSSGPLLPPCVPLRRSGLHRYPGQRKFRGQLPASRPRCVSLRSGSLRPATGCSFTTRDDPQLRRITLRETSPSFTISAPDLTGRKVTDPVHMLSETLWPQPAVCQPSPSGSQRETRHAQRNTAVRTAAQRHQKPVHSSTGRQPQNPHAYPWQQPDAERLEGQHPVRDEPPQQASAAPPITAHSSEGAKRPGTKLNAERKQDRA